MGKKVLIVSTSLRGKSNSETLAHEFERGAKDAGHDVEFLSLKGKKINFCVGCLTCGTRGRCFMDVPNDTKSKLRNVGDYAECPNCRRILYVADEQ